jgi:hypothetical protein
MDAKTIRDGLYSLRSLWGTDSPYLPRWQEGKFSIGNAKKSFVAKYGTELELLKKVQDLV